MSQPGPAQPGSDAPNPPRKNGDVNRAPRRRAGPAPARDTEPPGSLGGNGGRSVRLVSPDSQWLAFVGQLGTDENAELFVINADGTGEARLTPNTARAYRASWSPDGRRIAFGSKLEGTWRVYVMNPDGTGQVVVPRTEQGNVVAETAEPIMPLRGPTAWVARSRQREPRVTVATEWRDHP